MNSTAIFCSVRALIYFILYIYSTSNSDTVHMGLDFLTFTKPGTDEDLLEQNAVRENHHVFLES